MLLHEDYMKLFFDTETTGFITKDALDSPRQPHLVQLGAILTDDEYNELETLDVIIKPQKLYTIPSRAAEVHGITTERAEKEGVPFAVAINAFTSMLNVADTIVCHNAKFDITIMQIAYHRAGDVDTANLFHAKKVYDTMCDPQIINWCAIPPTMAMVRAGRNHYKTPNLTELYTKCFNKTFSNAHSALADCRALLEIVSHTSKVFANQ